MLGFPKYHINDEVSFIFGNEKFTGVIAVVDKNGSFFCENDVSYDIFVDDCLYKHVKESSIISRKIQKLNI